MPSFSNCWYHANTMYNILCGYFRLVAEWEHQKGESIIKQDLPFLVKFLHVGIKVPFSTRVAPLWRGLRGGCTGTGRFMLTSPFRSSFSLLSFLLFFPVVLFLDYVIVAPFSPTSLVDAVSICFGGIQLVQIVAHCQPILICRILVCKYTNITTLSMIFHCIISIIWIPHPYVMWQCCHRHTTQTRHALIPAVCIIIFHATTISADKHLHMHQAHLYIQQVSRNTMIQ